MVVSLMGGTVIISLPWNVTQPETWRVWFVFRFTVEYASILKLPDIRIRVEVDLKYRRKLKW